MDELCSRYQNEISEVAFVPSSGGVFEVTANDQTIFSKKETGRFPEAGEVSKILADKQGWQ